MTCLNDMRDLRLGARDQKYSHLTQFRRRVSWIGNLHMQRLLPTIPILRCTILKDKTLLPNVLCTQVGSSLHDPCFPLHIFELNNALLVIGQKLHKVLKRVKPYLFSWAHLTSITIILFKIELVILFKFLKNRTLMSRNPEGLYPKLPVKELGELFHSPKLARF